jgi:hypothetical protein
MALVLHTAVTPRQFGGGLSCIVLVLWQKQWMEDFRYVALGGDVRGRADSIPCTLAVRLPRCGWSGKRREVVVLLARLLPLIGPNRQPK